MALALPACSTPGSGGVGASAQARLALRADGALRVVYDVRVFAQSSIGADVYDLLYAAPPLEANNPRGAGSIILPCRSAPDPGLLGLLEVVATAYDAAGTSLGPPQQQTQVFRCRSISRTFSGDNFVPEFVFVFTTEVNGGFVDVNVRFGEAPVAFKVDITTLLPITRDDGSTYRAKTAVLGLSAAKSPLFGDRFPDLYTLARVQTPATCASCTGGRLRSEVFSGETLPAAGADQSKYLNTVFQMPGQPGSSDADFSLDAVSLLFPNAPRAAILPGAPLIAYSVESRFDSMRGYADTRRAEVRVTVAIGRVAESAGEHVYWVRNVAARLGEASVPGFELAASTGAAADAELNTFSRATYAARRADGSPQPIEARSVVAASPDGADLLVFVGNLDSGDSATVRAARCRVAASSVACRTNADGTLMLEAIAGGAGP